MVSEKLDRVLAQGPNSSSYKAAKEVLGGKRHPKVKHCLYFNGQQWTNHEGVNIGGNIFWQNEITLVDDKGFIFIHLFSYLTTLL